MQSLSGEYAILFTGEVIKLIIVNLLAVEFRFKMAFLLNSDLDFDFKFVNLSDNDSF